MLTDTDRAMLDLEGSFWRYAGTKEQEIRCRLQMSPTRYYSLLLSLLDSQDAWAYAPGTVGRLARIREQRRAARVEHSSCT